MASPRYGVTPRSGRPYKVVDGKSTLLKMWTPDELQPFLEGEREDMICALAFAAGHRVGLSVGLSKRDKLIAYAVGNFMLSVAEAAEAASLSRIHVARIRREGGYSW